MTIVIVVSDTCQ